MPKQKYNCVSDITYKTWCKNVGVEQCVFTFAAFLKANGFDIEKPIYAFKSVGSDVLCFNQYESEEIRNELLKNNPTEKAREIQINKCKLKQASSTPSNNNQKDNDFVLALPPDDNS